MKTTIFQIVVCVLVFASLIKYPNTLNLILLIMNVFLLGMRSGMYLIVKGVCK